MFNISRRFLLKWIAGSTLFALFKPVLTLGQEKIAPRPLDRLTLDAFVDRLIPKDEYPGAVELGISGQLLDKAQSSRRYYNLVSDGCLWLNRQAGQRGFKTFAVMPEAIQEAVIQQAADSPQRTLPGFFFARLWKDACFFYYSHPAVLKALPYAGPPQPFGFPDHTSPPVTNKLSDNAAGPQ